MWNKNNIPDQKGKTIVVTGANTGIGYETALALYEAGAHVILACRDLKKAENAISKLLQKGGTGSLEAAVLDLSDLTLVKQFSDYIKQKHTQLHVLINNAGVATTPPLKTVQGYELQFGINFLGHFALTGYLYQLLKGTPGSRIVTLSSNGYQHASIDFSNLKSEIDYDRMREYRQSKLANLVFSIELQRRIDQAGDHILSIAAQPGANKTDLTRHLSTEEVDEGTKRLGGFMEPWQGALVPLFAAVSDEASGGNLYEPHEGGFHGYPALASVNENALDRQVADQLWKLAEKTTGVYYPG